ncbi:tyrosine-type recombinase/integrase [Chloroflexota bacterium]
MAISTREIKNAVKEALTEQNEGGIQPIVFPPLEERSDEINMTVRTQDVVARLLHHKQYARKKDDTFKTYRKHLNRFARRFPVLPLNTEVIMDYLDQYKGSTGRYKRNQYDLLSMLYKHATRFFGILQNPIEDLERPEVTEKKIRALSLEEAYKVDSVVHTIRERAVWQLTFGHGWRQIEVRRITAGDVRSIRDGTIWCNGKEREEDTPLLPETQELLEHLAERLEDNEPVIRSTRIRAGRTQPLGADGISQLIKRFFSKLCIEYKGHDLRRTFCTMVREASGDEFLAMRLARDKIPGVNDRYINANPVKLRESLLKYSPIRLISQGIGGGEFGGDGGESNST